MSDNGGSGHFRAIFKVVVLGVSPTDPPLAEHYFYEDGRVANYYFNGGAGGTSWRWDPVTCKVTTERTLMIQLGPRLQDEYQKYLARIMLDG